MPSIQLLIDNPGLGEWTYDGINDGATTDPGSAEWKTNTANTRIEISVTTRNGLVVSAPFNQLVVGDHIYLRHRGQSRIYEIGPGDPVDHTTYFEFPVTIVSSSTSFALTQGLIYSCLIAVKANPSLATLGTGTLDQLNEVVGDEDVISTGAQEIYDLTLKATPASTDVVMIEDSESTDPVWQKKRTPVSALTGSGTDADAIHDNVAGEINAVTTKAAPVGADIVIIEDSESVAPQWAKKKVTITALNTIDSVFGRTGAVVAQSGDYDLSEIGAGLKANLDTLLTDANLVSSLPGEFAAGEVITTEKAVPVAADLLLIEDSAASGAKKFIQIGNLPLAADFIDLGDVPSSYTGHGGKYVVVTAGADGLEFVTVAPGGGDVTGGSISQQYEIAAYTDTTGKDIGRSDIKVNSSSPTVGTRTLSSNGTLAGGHIATGGTIASTGSGAVSLGMISQVTGTASMTTSGEGAVTLARVTSADAAATSTLVNSGGGALVAGFVSQAASGVATLTASGNGSFTGGSVASGGTIENATAAGATVRGQVSTSGILRATLASGALVHGVASGSGTLIEAATSANGSVALGRAVTAGQIRATANASIAIGNASTNDIIASATGAFALGDSTNGDVLAQATNSIQLGPGTNVEATSIAVGTMGSGGIRLIGDGAAAASPQNGDVHVASGVVTVRSNGANRYPVAALTKTLTVEDPVAETVYFLYTPVAITLSQVRVLIQGGTSIPFSLLSGTTYLTTVATNVSAETANNTTTGADLAIDVAAVAAGSHLWVTFGTPTGTQTLATCTIRYTED